MPPVKQAPDDRAAHRADDQDWCVRLGNDGGRQAQQYAEDKADEPSGPARQGDTADDKSDGESVNECPEQRCLLVRERERHHHQDRDRAKDHTSEETGRNVRHANN